MLLLFYPEAISLYKDWQIIIFCYVIPVGTIVCEIFIFFKTIYKSTY